MRRSFFAVPFVVLSCISSCTCNGGSPHEVAEAGFDAPPVFEASMPEAAPEAGMKDATQDTGPINDAAGDVMTVPLSASGSGAFGVITISGKQKMYLPVQSQNDAGNSVVAVVDVGLPGNGVAGAQALIKDVDLGTTNYATTTGGTTSMVIAASTNSDDVWFIDPATDTTVGHLNLGAMYGSSSFSGGGGFVTGIAADAATNRAFLSVWNGFAVVDLTTMMVTSVIQAPPSENFGYDSVNQRILAPFYGCSSSSLMGMAPSACNTPMALDGGGLMLSGLSIIDVKSNPPVVYTYEDPAAGDPTNPLGGEPDSAAADPTNQIYIVPSESSGYQNVLDFSKAVFDSTSLTVTAPHTTLTNIDYEGVALEPSSHLVFWEGEHSPNFAVGSAVAGNMGDQGYVYGTMPALPQGGGGFGNLGDPHGIAVADSIVDGKPVGFLVDAGLQWVARVDLSMLQSLQSVGGADASILLGTLEVNPAVTYLDATTAE